MSSLVVRPALVCPFTLMEEEALAWSILLFGQAVLLHPYPLPLPVSVQIRRDQGMIQIRSLVQTAESIREKDRLLRGIKQYLIDNPGRGFLKYLLGAASMDDQETQEEITGLMKGRPFLKPESFIINGPILLCLIHEWVMQEWEVETSLAAVEEQEKNLIQGWRESPEEETIWKSVDPMVLTGIETEINCPPALAAWRELKNTLVPEASILYTTQPWVWAKHYNLDPEENRIHHSIPLPDLGSLTAAPLQNPDFNMTIQEKVEAVLGPAPAIDPPRAVDDFQKALLELGLPPEGKYRLVFPPHLLFLGTPSSPGPGNSEPLILLLPALS
jgi:hypothetical protein